MREYLKISRPGLWFPTLWIYVLPVSGHLELLQEPSFWIGVLFVLFPLNFFVYSLNDLGDIEADAKNVRKGNFIFGAKSDRPTLKKAVLCSSIILFGFAVYFVVMSKNPFILLLFASIALINYVYNFAPFRIKSRPPLELLIQVGYLLTALFSSLWNGVDIISWQAFVYLSFFCFQAHLAGEIMDIDPDLESGKTTTAVMIGRKRSKWLMVMLLAIEVYILGHWFNDWVLASVLAGFMLWLILDVLVLFKGRAYRLSEMFLFGFGMNILGFASMIWVLYSAKLLSPVFP